MARQPASWKLIGRLAVELVVVIAGILIAFQLEDVREARARSSQETALLRGLRVDLEGSLARMDSVRPSQQQVVEAARGLLEVSLGHSDAPATDSLAVLFTTAGTWHRLEPLTGTYDAMISSGTIDLIEDQELLASLATLSSDLGAGYEDGPESEALLLEMVRAQAQYGLDHLTVRLGRLGIARDPRREPLLSLLQDGRYTHFLGRRALLELRRLEYFERIQANLEAAFERVNRNLEGRAL